MMDLLKALSIAVIVMLVYFFPTCVAWYRRAAHDGLIGFVNLLVGVVSYLLLPYLNLALAFGIIAWVGLLIWAFYEPLRKPQPRSSWADPFYERPDR